jgi:hypothetical protein
MTLACPVPYAGGGQARFKGRAKLRFSGKKKVIHEAVDHPARKGGG